MKITKSKIMKIIREEIDRMKEGAATSHPPIEKVITQLDKIHFLKQDAKDLKQATIDLEDQMDRETDDQPQAQAIKRAWAAWEESQKIEQEIKRLEDAVMPHVRRIASQFKIKP
jgi:hypothetical protein